jgi:drug/metabolite transporter (DMT)-like permease
MLQYLVPYVPDGFTTNLVRYPVACLFYLPLLIEGLLRRRGGRFWLAALLPAAVNLVGQTLWGIAPYHHLTAGVIAFLLRLSVIWGILAAFWLFPDERVLARSRMFWMGVILALGGFALMSWAHVLRVREAGWDGLVIMFFCGICYGLYGVTVRYVMGKLNPLFVFAVVGSYTSIGLIALAPLGEPRALLHLPAIPWIVMLVSALVGIALAHGMYYAAIQRVGAAVATIMLSVTPFVSICGSSLFLGEHFTSAQWLGGTILVLGAACAMQAHHATKPVQPALPTQPTQPIQPA